MTIASSVKDSIGLERLLSPGTAGCARCLTRLQERIIAIPGVRDVQINDRLRRADVGYDPAAVSLPEI